MILIIRSTNSGEAKFDGLITARAHHERLLVWLEIAQRTSIREKVWCISRATLRKVSVKPCYQLGLFE